MSYYPLTNDEDALRRLDGWLLHTLWCALRKRTRLLRAAGHRILPAPHGYPRRALLGLRAQSMRTGAALDARVPSLLRMSRLLQKAATSHGTSATANPQSKEYYRSP